MSCPHSSRRNSTRARLPGCQGHRGLAGLSRPDTTYTSTSGAGALNFPGKDNENLHGLPDVDSDGTAGPPARTQEDSQKKERSVGMASPSSGTRLQEKDITFIF